MELLIFALVAAAAVVLTLGPLFGHVPQAPPEDETVAPPSDRDAILEDIATGKLSAAQAQEEEAR